MDSFSIIIYYLQNVFAQNINIIIKVHIQSNIMSSDISCSKADLSGALSSLNINVNESNNEELEAANINSVAICAACGKEGDGDNMNTCNKCDLVKYCNAACKKKHKSKHKKKCERRVAELYDKQLFKEHPPGEECPICMLPLPLAANQITFHACCGKDICSGCVFAMDEREGVKLCAFCRTPYAKSDEEIIASAKKLMEKGNAHAYYQLAGYYANGAMGVPQNRAKANELYLKAGELGCALAYFSLGNANRLGQGMEIDTEKAKHYYELAANNGSVHARNNLGVIEGQAGDHQRARKHFILAARAGFKQSLEAVKDGYKHGFVTKDEYANTLRAYQKSQDEMKSVMRDKAEVFRNQAVRNQLRGG